MSFEYVSCVIHACLTPKLRTCTWCLHWSGVTSFSHSVSSLQQAAHTQEALEEAVQMMKEAVEDLTTTLNEAASAAGVVGGMVDSITQAINQVKGTQRGLRERRSQSNSV